MQQQPLIVQRSLELATESHPMALGFDYQKNQPFQMDTLYSALKAEKKPGSNKRKRSPSKDDSDSDSDSEMALEIKAEFYKKKLERKRAKKDDKANQEPKKEKD